MEKKEYGWKNGDRLKSHDYLLPYILKELVMGNNIIDVGCGNGAIARELINRGYTVYGIDSDKKGVDIAQKALGSNEQRFFCVDVETGEIPKEISRVSFDVAISTEVIEHVYSPDSMMDFFQLFLSRVRN